MNNLQGKCVKNTRQSIRQGDKFAMELFSFWMDPILGYLEKRLQGIIIHSIPVHGPIMLPRPPPAPRPAPSPPIPGLPALPPPPPVNRPSRQVQRHHILPGLETKCILYAYCDDLKPAITNIWEFNLVERVMTLFELSSGCKMHRTAASQKCKFLPLGKWQTELTQEMIPHQFFSLSNHLDFLRSNPQVNLLINQKKKRGHSTGLN